MPGCLRNVHLPPRHGGDDDDGASHDGEEREKEEGAYEEVGNDEGTRVVYDALKQALA